MAAKVRHSIIRCLTALLLAIALLCAAAAADPRAPTTLQRTIVTLPTLPPNETAPGRTLTNLAPNQDHPFRLPFGVLKDQPTIIHYLAPLATITAATLIYLHLQHRPLLLVLIKILAVWIAALTFLMGVAWGADYILKGLKLAYFWISNHTVLTTIFSTLLITTLFSHAWHRAKNRLNTAIFGGRLLGQTEKNQKDEKTNGNVVNIYNGTAPSTASTSTGQDVPAASVTNRSQPEVPTTTAPTPPPNAVMEQPTNGTQGAADSQRALEAAAAALTELLPPAAHQHVQDALQQVLQNQAAPAPAPEVQCLVAEATTAPAIATYCPANQLQAAGPQGAEQPEYQRRLTRCFYCGQGGHFFRNCPERTSLLPLPGDPVATTAPEGRVQHQSAHVEPVRTPAVRENLEKDAPQSRRRCRVCGEDRVHDFRTCSAKRDICGQCGTKGHLTKACTPERRRQAARERETPVAQVATTEVVSIKSGASVGDARAVVSQQEDQEMNSAGSSNTENQVATVGDVQELLNILAKKMDGLDKRLKSAVPAFSAGPTSATTNYAHIPEYEEIAEGIHVPTAPLRKLYEKYHVTNYNDLQWAMRQPAEAATRSLTRAQEYLTEREKQCPTLQRLVLLWKAEAYEKNKKAGRKTAELTESEMRFDAPLTEEMKTWRRSAIKQHIDDLSFDQWVITELKAGRNPQCCTSCGKWTSKEHKCMATRLADGGRQLVVTETTGALSIARAPAENEQKLQEQAEQARRQLQDLQRRQQRATKIREDYGITASVLTASLLPSGGADWNSPCENLPTDEEAREEGQPAHFGQWEFTSRTCGGGPSTTSRPFGRGSALGGAN